MWWVLIVIALFPVSTIYYERNRWLHRLVNHHENMPDNFDPLKPHFYIVKLGFTGVYIIFLFLLKNIDCWYSLEPPRRGGLARRF